MTVNVSAEIFPLPGMEEEAFTAVETALRGCFTGASLGRDVLLAELGNAVYSTGAVKNYRLLSPAADIAVAADRLPVLGQLSVTEG